MKTGKLVRYLISPGQVMFILLLEDGTEVEVSINADVSVIVGDDIFHTIYVGEDDEKKPIRKIERTLDPISGYFIDHNDENEIEYELE